MTDERWRDLERRSLAGGAPDDDARLLLERVRRGELTSEALQLAAAIGHPAACAALGREPADVRALSAAIAADEGRRARAALALAELALPAWTWPQAPDEAVPGDPVRAAVTSLRAAASRPGAGAAAVGREAAEAISWEMAYGYTGATWLRPLAATIVRHAALGLTEHGPYHLRAAAELSADVFGAHRLRDALAAALLPAPLRPTPREGPPPEWTDEPELIGRRLAEGLPRDRVTLAHALGHEPASQALGLTPHAREPDRWLEAVAGSGPLGAEAGVRSVVAIAVGELARDEDTAAGRALLAAEAWVLEPTPARARAAAAAAHEATRAPASYRLKPERHLSTMLNAETAVPAVAPELGALAARAAARAGLEGAPPVDELREALEGGSTREVDTLRDVFHELVPWALGYADDVRDRAERGPDAQGPEEPWGR